METAEIAEPIWGDMLYQQRARLAFPMLVRQALAGKPLTYEDLAEELEMPNPRNLNYVLGSIGNANHLGIPFLGVLLIDRRELLPHILWSCDLILAYSGN